MARESFGIGTVRVRPGRAQNVELPMIRTVTGAENDRAVIKAHDIGIQIVDRDGDLGYRVVVGGGLGRTPLIGQVLRDFLPRADLLPYVESILAAYNAAKHAVVGMVRGLAADLVGTGVTAVAVSPGGTDTPMLAATAALYGTTSEHLAEHQLLRRPLDPDEIAATVSLCCSPAGAALNGGVVAADGRNSAVRQALGIGVRTLRYGQKALAFAVTHPIPHDNVSTEIHRWGGPFTLVPLPDRDGKPSSAVVWMENGRETARLRALPRAAFEAALTEARANVDAIDQHAALNWVVQPRHNGRDGALARATRAHQVRRALQLHRHVAQHTHIRPRGIRQAHTLQRQAPLHRRQRLRSRRDPARRHAAEP